MRYPGHKCLKLKIANGSVKSSFERVLNDGCICNLTNHRPQLQNEMGCVNLLIQLFRLSDGVSRQHVVSRVLTVIYIQNITHS